MRLHSVLIAAVPALALMLVIGNASTAQQKGVTDMDAQYTPNEQFQAGAKVWLAYAYTTDLLEFAAGDVNRFSRMVNGRGVAVASPAMWLQYLANIANSPVVQHFYADKINDYITRLQAAGYQLPTQLN